MSLVDENKKNIVSSELDYLNYWIENDYKNLSITLSSEYNCRKFNHNEDYYTKEEFDSLQNRQNVFCEWAKKSFEITNSCYKSEKKYLKEFPKLNIENAEIYSYDEILNWRKNININLEKKNLAEKILKDNFWNDFKLTFGLLLIYFAIGLRLAITTNKIRTET
jgi:hypothetical protein